MKGTPEMTPRDTTTNENLTDDERAAAELADREAQAAREADEAAKAEAERAAAAKAEQERANAAAVSAAASVEEADTSGRPPLNELAEERAAERDRVEQLMTTPTPPPAA